MHVLRTHTYLFGTKFVFDNDPREVLPFLPGMLHCKYYQKHELGQGWHVVFSRMWNPWEISESLKRVPIPNSYQQQLDVCLDVPEGLHTISDHYRDHGRTSKRTKTTKHKTFLNQLVSLDEFPTEVIYEQDKTTFKNGEVIKELPADREIREKKPVFVRTTPVRRRKPLP